MVACPIHIPFGTRVGHGYYLSIELRMDDIVCYLGRIQPEFICPPRLLVRDQGHGLYHGDTVCVEEVVIRDLFPGTGVRDQCLGETHGLDYCVQDRLAVACQMLAQHPLDAYRPCYLTGIGHQEHGYGIPALLLHSRYEPIYPISVLGEPLPLVEEYSYIRFGGVQTVDVRFEIYQLPPGIVYALRGRMVRFGYLHVQTVECTECPED